MTSCIFISQAEIPSTSKGPHDILVHATGKNGKFSVNMIYNCYRIDIPITAVTLVQISFDYLIIMNYEEEITSKGEYSHWYIYMNQHWKSVGYVNVMVQRVKSHMYFGEYFIL